MAESDPFSLTAGEIKDLLSNTRAYIPELAQTSTDSSTLRQAWASRFALDSTKPLMESVRQIPITGYTAYRRFRRDGDRRQYETPYFAKRENLSYAAQHHRQAPVGCGCCRSRDQIP